MEVLRCENLCKAFEGTPALDGIGVSFPPSGVVGIIGPNGAGKTTFLNVLTGFLRPNAGTVYLGRTKLTHLPPRDIVRAGISRTFQELRVVTLISVLENVMLARPNQSGERLWRALSRIGVEREEHRNRTEAERLLEFVGLADRAGEPAGELSYGQQKLLSLACCLATEARILLLDEPVAGVHPEMAERILGLLEQLRDSGKLIVFIEHDMDAVRKIADVVYVMDDGKVIAEGPPAEVLERPEIMEAFVA